MCLVPVYLSQTQLTTGETNRRYTLEFSPVAGTVLFSQADQSSDSFPGCDPFNVSDWADDFKVHVVDLSSGSTGGNGLGSLRPAENLLVAPMPFCNVLQYTYCFSRGHSISENVKLSTVGKNRLPLAPNRQKERGQNGS